MTQLLVFLLVSLLPRSLTPALKSSSLSLTPSDNLHVPEKKKKKKNLRTEKSERRYPNGTGRVPAILKHPLIPRVFAVVSDTSFPPARQELRHDIVNAR